MHRHPNILGVEEVRIRQRLMKKNKERKRKNMIDKAI